MNTIFLIIGKKLTFETTAKRNHSLRPKNLYATIHPMIERIKKNIDLSLKKYLRSVKHDFQFRLVDPILYNSIEEFALRKGKRLRPIFLILSYLSHQKQNARPNASLYRAASCIELLHIFMLIHDDLIDCSHLRRGKPTMHRLLKKTTACSHPKKLGNDLSIIAGDIVYALAIDAFLSIKEDPWRKEKALKYFVQTAAFTAMGEFFDIVNGVKKISQVKEKDVFLNYSLKTARYTFECPLVIGAILAGAKKSEVDRLSRLGQLSGQAFQIQDDILGIYANEKNIGKSILSDLAEAKKTILTAHAYRHLKGRQRKQLLEIFKKDRIDYADLRKIRSLFFRSGSLNYAIDKTKRLLTQANKIYLSLSLKEPYRSLIWQSLEKLFDQSKRIAGQYGIDRPVI